MPPLPAVSLRAGICSWSQIPNVHLQVDTALEFPAAAVPHRIPMALPRQTLGSLETPLVPSPSPGPAQGSSLPTKTCSPQAKELLLSGSGTSLLEPELAGAEQSRRKSRLACVGNTFSLHLGLFQSKSLSAGLLARPRPQTERQRKFMGLERFQTKHSWLREAGLFPQSHSKPAPVPNRFVL